MLVLHQWCRITAYGDDAIIRKANEIQLWKLVVALSRAAAGYKPITNIDDAIEYIHMVEQGCIKDEIQPNEIVCEE